MKNINELNKKYVLSLVEEHLSQADKRTFTTREGNVVVASAIYKACTGDVVMYKIKITPTPDGLPCVIAATIKFQGELVAEVDDKIVSVAANLNIILDNDNPDEDILGLGLTIESRFYNLFQTI